MNLTIELGNLPLLINPQATRLQLPCVNDQEFYEFCLRNPLLNVERDPKGKIHFMPPVEAWTDSRGGDLFVDLALWNRSLPNPGFTFGPTAGFHLPNGAVRAPDASWLLRERWDALPDDLRYPYPHLCPDFVAEVMSPSDRLSTAKAKMREYQANGARLGWLIDRKRRTVYVYRAGVGNEQPEQHSDPATLSGDPELPGFVADIARVFE